MRNRLREFLIATRNKVARKIGMEEICHQHMHITEWGRRFIVISQESPNKL